MGLFPGNHSPTEGRRDNVPQASFSSKSSSRPALALVCPHQPSHQQLPPPLQLLFPAGDTASQAGARVSQLLNHDGIFPPRWRHVVAGDKCSTSCGLGLVVVVGVFSMDMSQLRHSSDSGSVGKFVIAPTDDVRMSLFIAFYLCRVECHLIPLRLFIHKQQTQVLAVARPFSGPAAHTETHGRV
jgi:hypothetical protein